MAANEPDEDDDLAERLAAYEEGGRQPSADDTPPSFDAEAQQRLQDDKGFLDFLAQTWPTSESATSPATMGSFGRFQILRELGRGGFGMVFLAWDPIHQRQVALKLPRLETLVTPGARRLFLREAQIAATLDHPQLVRVYEAGEIGPICYLACAYTSGLNLSEWLLCQTQPVPPHQAAQLVAILAEAVAFLHARGILHRDLKPTNVLLQRHEGEEISSFGVPRITDFGLARLMERPSGDETTSGVVVGSPRYMAPEQALDRRSQIGPATDVYALGVLLYEVLTRTTPFQGRTPLEVFRHMLADDPPRLRRLRPDVPPALEAICERCLHQNPRQRYAHAADLASDLTCFIRGERVSVRPAGALRRGLRWMQRHRIKAALLAALVFIAVALPLGLFLHTIRLQGALDEAERAQARARHNESIARNLQYASDMELASKMLRAGEVVRLPDLLDRHVPAQDGNVDHRGFEWWYLQRHRPASPTAFKAHSRPIMLLKYAPDGKGLMTSSWDGSQLTVWDLTSSTARLRLPHRQDPRVRGPAYASQAGLLATLLEGNNDVVIWDAATGAERTQLTPGSGPLYAALSPDGRLLAVGGNGPITIWDLATGKNVRTLADMSRYARQVTFSPDGRSLASGPFLGGEIHVWNPITGTLRRVLQQPFSLDKLEYSPRGTLLVATRSSAKPAFWTADGTPCLDWLPQTTVGARAAALTVNERLLALGMGDGAIQLWDLPSRRQLGSFRWQAVPISHLAFSPNGRTLAVGTDEGMVYQLDTAVPGAPDAFQPPLGWAEQIAVSPDGRTLALAGGDRGVRLLDARAGTLRLKLPPHPNTVALMEFAADGQTLATAGNEDPCVRLWDVATGQLQMTLPYEELHPEEAIVRCLTFSPARSALVVGRRNGRLEFWNTGTRIRQASDTSHRADVFAAAFAPDGRTLATADGKGMVLLWDVVGAEPPKARRPELQLGRPVHSLVFSRDGRSLVTGDDDGQIRLWQVGPKGPPRPLTNLGDKSDVPVDHVSFSSDGRTLLVVHGNGKVKLWDFPARSIKCLLELDRSPGRIRPPTALAPDGQALFTVRGDGSLETWNLHGPTVYTTLNQGLGAVRSLAFTPDGGSLVVGSKAPDAVVTRFQTLGLGSFLRKEAHIDTVALREPGSTVRLWDLASRSERDRLPGPAALAAPSLVAVAPAGSTMAAGGEDGSVWIWDRAASRLLARRFISPRAEDYVKGMDVGHSLIAARPEYPESISSVALSPNGRLLAAASNRGTVKLWAADGWRPRHTWKGADCSWVGFAPDGKTLAVARDGQALLFDADTGKLQQTLGERSGPAVHCGAFNLRGSLLAIAYASRGIRFWDLKTGQSSAPMLGHGDRISALTFAPDGKTLASSSWDRTARLWSVTARQEVLTLEAHHGRVYSLAFSPDGKVLATGGDNESGKGEIYLWYADRSK